MEKGAIKISAHAKINLYLDVLGKRVDGYHNIQSVMQSLELSDELLITPHDDDIMVEVSPPINIPMEDNLVFKAAKMLQQEAREPLSAKIQIKKLIPVASGLGGGSADAAATIIGLNKVWKLDLPYDYLLSLGAKIGADVPFCMEGGTVLAEGKGEKLTLIPNLPLIYTVVACPPFEVSTRIIYSQLDLLKIPPIHGVTKILAALKEQSLDKIGDSLANVLEEITLASYPEVAKLKEVATAAGAVGVLMSGSGPAIFALAHDQQTLERLAQALSQYVEEVFVTAVYPGGLDIF